MSAYGKSAYAYATRHKIVTGIFLVLCAYGGYHYYTTRASATTTYQYAIVKRGAIESTVSGTGQVTPNSQVDLKPKVNANVVAVYVKSGDRVKAGQVLFRLDATDAYKQVRDAKIALQSAQLSLEKLKNPKASDITSINNSIKQEEDAKADEDRKVNTAQQTLLNSNLAVTPDVDSTIETAPTLSGSYSGTSEGELKLSVYQGGPTGYSFSVSGLATCTGEISQIIAEPICGTGLYIKWNSSSPQTNWVIDIPNKQSSSYLSNYTALQTAISNRDSNNAASDRNIEELKQKLADLSPGEDNIDVQSAELTVQQRQNALMDAQNNLANYVITAPFDGVMASVSVDIGSSAVMASANGSSALGTIVTDKQLAQVTLNESDIAKVHLGQKANVTIDVLDNVVLDGQVAEITTLGTVTSGVVTYKVKVAFASSAVTILPNMSVSVDIITDSKDNVLYVPNQAVKHDSAGYYVEENPAMAAFASSTRKFDRGTSSLAFASSTDRASTTGRRGSSTYSRSSSSQAVAQANVVLTRIPVTIGTQSDKLTEITSGLQEGDRIVLKKTTLTAAQAAAAPSVTSLLRPQGAGRTQGGGGGGNFRAGQ
jgi:HlyD family secretion protein